MNFSQVLLGELGLRRIPGWVGIQEKHTGKSGNRVFSKKTACGPSGKTEVDRAARAASQVDNVVKAVRRKIYSKLYGNAGEKMRRFERFDSKKMILEFLGVIICFLIAFVFMSVRLSAHALYS